MTQCSQKNLQFTNCEVVTIVLEYQFQKGGAMEVVEMNQEEKYIKVQLRHLMSQEYNEAFHKLSKLTTLPGATAFKVRRISKKVTAALEDYSELRLEALKAVSKKDENGQLVIVKENGMDSYVILDEHKADFAKKVKELQEVEVEIEKIKFDDLGPNHGISAFDLMQLEFIVE